MLPEDKDEYLRRGAAMALRAGANDLGGTLMNERISRAAGAAHARPAHAWNGAYWVEY